MSVAEVIKIVKDTAKDETVMKYLTRFRQKLKQPLQVEQCRVEKRRVEYRAAEDQSREQFCSVQFSSVHFSSVQFSSFQFSSVQYMKGQKKRIMRSVNGEKSGGYKKEVQG